jgi:hypothetical protein
MEQKNKKSNYFITQVLILFAVNILMLIVFLCIFGDRAKNLSSIYQLGSQGLAVSTMLQFLLSSVVIISLQHLFFSEKISKKMTALWRTILFLFSILAFMVLFIIIFDWFPLNNLYAWLGFLTCFVGGFVIGTSTMIIKTKLDNRRYNALLSLYKDQHKGDDEDESYFS